jgi:hypothetical protein
LWEDVLNPFLESQGKSHMKTKKIGLSGYASVPANAEVVVEVPADLSGTELEWLKEGLCDADVQEWDIAYEICEITGQEWDHDLELTGDEEATHRLVRGKDGTLSIERV